MPPRTQPLNPPIPALLPERDALLAAVRDADPADDLPALVYADWQDEHGQPEHAELIRVMVELPKTRKQTPEAKARKMALLARVKELFKTPALKPLRKLESDGRKFTRGFVHDMTFRLVPWLDPPYRGDEVEVESITNLPTVVPFDKLVWIGVMMPSVPLSGCFEMLAAQGWFSRVNHLELHRWETEPVWSGTLAPLIASQRLGSLRTFGIGTSGINGQWGTIAESELVGIYLAKSATGLREFPLASAQRLTNTDKSFTPDRKAFLRAVEQIVSAKRARQFTSFGEATSDVDDPLAKILLASPYLKSIGTFRYEFTKATPKTRAAFVERFGKPES